MIRRLLLTLLLATLTGCGASNDPPSLGVSSAEVQIWDKDNVVLKGNLLPDSTLFMKLEKLIKSRAGRWTANKASIAPDISIDTPNVFIELQQRLEMIVLDYKIDGVRHEVCAPLNSTEYSILRTQLEIALKTTAK